MNTLIASSPLNSSLAFQLGSSPELSSALLQQRDAAPPSDNLDEARELRTQFSQFFGETFYGQMIKSMRSSVGEPAYFHGGRAEDIFQGQLNQALSEELTAASADRLIGPMFAQAFPRAAETLAAHERPPSQQSESAQLSDLNRLRRR